MGKWTRRGFITAGILGGGAFVLGVAVRPGHRVPRLKGLVSDGSDTLVNAWVKISPDNRVTVIVPHCEMGQGVHTSLPMMLADEMGADWAQVDVLEAPAEMEYANYALARGFIMGNVDVPKALVQTVNGGLLKITQMIKLQLTGGSTSVRTTGIHAMQAAGAAAREMLIRAAADSWQVPMREVRAEGGYLHNDDGGHKASFAAFASAAAAMTPPSAPRLKRVDEYTIVGTSPARLDLPAKVDGSAGFGIDVKIPGMKYATVRAAPVFGTRLLRVDTSDAIKLPGVLEIIELEQAVAVVADGYWQALQALNALRITWSESENDETSSDTLLAQFRAEMDRAVAAGDEKTDLSKGDIDIGFADVGTIVEAEYTVPYLAHAPMEPLNCTASVAGGRCEIWTGNQNPLGFRAEVAEALGMDLENVTVHNAYLGGGFGRRFMADYAVQAALIARELAYPVKLIWSREEDIRQDRYRQASISRFKAGLDNNGKPQAWVNQFVDKHDPEEASHIPYDIRNQHIHYVDSPTHIPFGPWRSVDHSLHAFFTESFIDELAHKAGQDPYQYRRDLLASSPRLQRVLDVAAESADWGSPLPAGHGRGIAIHKSFGSIIAQVAEVATGTGGLRVKRVVCAVDVGLAINPDGLKAQMESGIIFGLTAALYGKIEIENGAVRQSNFHDYPMLRIDQSPMIETHIVNSGEALGGAGEPGTPPIAPAVANALFAATGQRHRSLPLEWESS